MVGWLDCCSLAIAQNEPPFDYREFLIKVCSKVNHYTMASGDWKALLKAIQDGDQESARHFIQSGVDINYEHPEMMTTLLIEAVQAGQEEMAALLLEHGADPKQRAGFGNKTALEIARANKNERILQLLDTQSGGSRFRFWQKWLAGFRRL